MFQLGFVGEDILNSVKDFFQLVFVELADLWFWPVIVLGLMVLSVIVLSLLVAFSYENRILKSVNKINTYFLSKPFITEENLVEFNLKMKKVPKVLRNNWQIYMLNREDSPTTYINVNTCIDKPLRTSSIEKNMGNYTIFTIFLTFLSFIIGLQYSKSVLALTNAADILFFASLVPFGLLFVYTIFILILKAAKNDIYACLYDNFPLYERNLTKAVSTLPSYVDYEILFTKKEIKEGIPILQQYLEKRALVEQQELEKARANSMAVEEYDFSELGIDGSLVLERSMKESETFIRTRRRLQEECDQIEAEMENYKKNFDITSKDYQRKLQASRENLESLKAQQESSTNRIESNYIRKQQSDEIKKQQQLEKDNEEANAKFNEEQVSLQQEIEKRKQEIEEKKTFVQQAMLLEFKHYANTLFNALLGKATEVANQKLVSLAQENTDLKALVTDIQGLDLDEKQISEQNVVQSQDVAGEGIYEMSNSDETQLEEGRKTSKKFDKEESEKEKKQKEIQKAQQELEAQNEQTLQNNNQDVNKPETVNETSDDDNDNVTNIDDNNNGDLATDSSDDGQKMQDENQEEQDAVENQEEKNQEDENQEVDENQEEDLKVIQQQIEEESNKLKRQKREFEDDLKTTLSKINNKKVVEIENDQDDFNDEEDFDKVEKPSNDVSEKTQKRNNRKEVDKSNRAKKTLRKPLSRQRVERGRLSSRERVDRNKKSGIEALNDEMNKLLKSTKK